MKVLVVGQGLAGTVLSHYLTTYEIDHKVLDDHHQSAATKAAAGLINPITGRHYIKSWMIEDLLPKAKSCYEDLSSLLSIQLVKEIEILRTLPTVSAENKWQESTARPGYEQYFDSSGDLNDYKDIVNAEGAYGLIKKGLQVNIGQLIESYRDYLTSKGDLINQEINYSSIDFTSEIKLEGEKYDLAIFCEGSRAIENPYFKYLPFRPAKGQSFEIEIEKDIPQKALRDDIFLIPQKLRSFWTGGSYEKESYNILPTEDFKQQWKEKLDKLLKIPYQIVSHQAGIRPAVKDRRPLLGRHAQYPHLCIFNGMGTKGTSLAPYFADQLIQHIIEGQELNPNVDIKRFEDH